MPVGMTVSAFIDESGKFKDHKVVSLGLVASFAEDFKNIANECGRLLHFNGLKELSAKKVLNANRPLSDKVDAIGVRNRTDALLPFVTCIRKHLQVVSGIAIDVRTFKKLPSHFFQFFGTDPIYMAFARSVLQVVEFTPEQDRISLICD